MTFFTNANWFVIINDCLNDFILISIQELPPSTPVKKGAEPLNASLDLNPLSNIKSPKVMGTLNLEDTPSTMIKSKLKKKIAKKPENVCISIQLYGGVL